VLGTWIIVVFIKVKLPFTYLHRRNYSVISNKLPCSVVLL
jgi:hypothetical protein